MSAATPRELVDFLRRDKQALLAAWEKEVRKLPRETKLSTPVLLDHVPSFIEELIRDLEDIAASSRTSSISRIHGEQRQTVGLDLADILEEYKLLRACIVMRAEAAGLLIGGEAGQLLHRIIDNAMKSAVLAHTARREQEQRTRREEYLEFIVHDLRSPLTSIHHTMILLEHRLTKIRAEEIDLSVPATVKRNIAKMQSMIAKLLQEEHNVRLESSVEVRRSEFHMRSIVEVARTTLAPLADAARTHVINEVPEEIVANADPELIERVFQNLISNAIDHTPNGTVTIGARVANNCLTCWVSDTGLGIPDELKAKVFEKFATTRRRGGGMGLGLTVVKQVIEAHGGKVELASEIGKGTIVSFHIPAGTAADAPVAAKL